MVWGKPPPQQRRQQRAQGMRTADVVVGYRLDNRMRRGVAHLLYTTAQQQTFAATAVTVEITSSPLQTLL